MLIVCKIYIFFAAPPPCIKYEAHPFWQLNILYSILKQRFWLWWGWCPSFPLVVRNLCQEGHPTVWNFSSKFMNEYVQLVISGSKINSRLLKIWILIDKSILDTVNVYTPQSDISLEEKNIWFAASWACCDYGKWRYFSMWCFWLSCGKISQRVWQCSR